MRNGSWWLVVLQTLYAWDQKKNVSERNRKTETEQIDHSQNTNYKWPTRRWEVFSILSQQEKPHWYCSEAPSCSGLNGYHRKDRQQGALWAQPVWKSVWRFLSMKKEDRSNSYHGNKKGLTSNKPLKRKKPKLTLTFSLPQVGFEPRSNTC